MLGWLSLTQNTWVLLSTMRNMRDIFDLICTKISGVVAKWKHRLISATRKEVLYKIGGPSDTQLYHDLIPPPKRNC